MIKRFLSIKAGQFTMTLGMAITGFTFIGSIATAYFTNLLTINKTIAEVKEDYNKSFSSDRERIAKTEEAISTFKDNNKVVNEKLDTIIKAIQWQK